MRIFNLCKEITVKKSLTVVALATLPLAACGTGPTTPEASESAASLASSASSTSSAKTKTPVSSSKPRTTSVRPTTAKAPRTTAQTRTERPAPRSTAFVQPKATTKPYVAPKTTPKVSRSSVRPQPSIAPRKATAYTPAPKPVVKPKTNTVTPAPKRIASAPTTGSDSARWARIAQCESGGNPTTNTGNGYYGLYQFTPSTWRAYGGSKYGANAHQATAAQQTEIARNVQRGQGWGAWPTCGR